MIELIKKFESLSLRPYLCPAHVPTIGYGNTTYADGTPVKMSDKAITVDKAEALLRDYVIKNILPKIDDLDLSVKTYNRLRRSGIIKVSDLCNMTVEEAMNTGIKKDSPKGESFCLM